MNHNLNLKFENTDDGLVKVGFTLRVPQDYHREPIITQLVAKHGLTVNIVGAILGENTTEDGWFNLELKGTSAQIQSGLVYLKELDLEIWDKNSTDDNW